MLTVERVTRHRLGDAYLLRTADGRALEAYFSGDYVQNGDTLRARRYGTPGTIPVTEKAIVKLSVSSGCPYRCAPCDAGLAGYGGPASAEEIVAQFEHVLADQQLEHCAHLKLHVSKLGEPALNWPATLQALRTITAGHPEMTIVPTVSTLPRRRDQYEGLLDGLFSWDHPLKQLKINLASTDESHRRRLLGPVMPITALCQAICDRLPDAAGTQRVTLTLLALPGVRLDAGALIGAVPAAVRSRIAVELYKVNQTRNAVAHDLRSSMVRYADADMFAPELDRLRQAGFFTYVSAPSNGEQAALIANGSSLLHDSGAKAASAS